VDTDNVLAENSVPRRCKGVYADKEAELFVDGARKAGTTNCVAADKLKDMPNLIHASILRQAAPKAASKHEIGL